MNSKYLELVSIKGNNCNYTAVVFNPLGQYYEELYFLYYTKKEMIYLLRHKYNVIVRRGF